MAGPPFWSVYGEHGQIPVFEHKTYESALAEAERLAALKPGKRFYVLAPVTSVRKTDFDREHFDGIPF
jgi:hypothetical protein